MKFLIDFLEPHSQDGKRLRCQLSEPITILKAYRIADVRAVLDNVQSAAENGCWCLGWVCYEAAAAFDRAYVMAVHSLPENQPLAWFAVFNQECVRHEASWPIKTIEKQLPLWKIPLSQEDFNQAIEQIHQAIIRGDCYQINYTTRLLAQWKGALPTLFNSLRKAQPNGYLAYIDTGAEQVLSLSPELFFDWDGTNILTRPMKGTAARGNTAEQDLANKMAMQNSPKERAENVMIVDLLRNDLSKIALPHSVRVTRLFHAEALPTVWQMTSDIQAKTREETRLVDVFSALFPCGSITGAPKREAIRLIHQLEKEPRGVYCGAVGLVRPSQQVGKIHATFNVPIRTVVARGEQLVCGIGSGITSSATATAEWQEWQYKCKFLKQSN